MAHRKHRQHVGSGERVLALRVREVAPGEVKVDAVVPHGLKGRRLAPPGVGSPIVYIDAVGLEQPPAQHRAGCLWVSGDEQAGGRKEHRRAQRVFDVRIADGLDHGLHAICGSQRRALRRRTAPRNLANAPRTRPRKLRLTGAATFLVRD